MDDKHNIRITPRDRLMHAWTVSMGLVWAYEGYAKELTDDKEAAELFARMAEDVCVHASRLLELLHDRDGAE